MCGIPFSGKTTVARQLAQARGCAYLSLDDINAERGLRGGDGIAIQEWDRIRRMALVRMQELMVRLGDIVLDDTSCFRWLRDRYRDSALKNGYVTELVYLEVSLAEVEAKMERNGMSGSRHLIDGNVFEENIRVLKLLSLTKPPR